MVGLAGWVRLAGLADAWTMLFGFREEYTLLPHGGDQSASFCVLFQCFPGRKTTRVGLFLGIAFTRFLCYFAVILVVFWRP